MKLYSLLTAICSCIFLSYGASAQAPANDICTTPAFITPNGTLVNGNLANATDNFIGTIGCQTAVGAHPDVWYTFVATGTQAAFTLNAGTTTGDLEVLLIQGNCNGIFTVLGSQCGQSPITGSFNGLQSGSSYYYVVSTAPGGSPGTFTTSVTTTNPLVISAQDCNNAAILCGQNGFTQAFSNNGQGLISEVTSTNSCLMSNEHQAKWFKFTVSQTGTLEFNINPITPTDYDWAIWDVTSNPTQCGTLGPSIACNYAGATSSTGLSSCPSNEPNYIGDTQWLNQPAGSAIGTGQPIPIVVQAGHTYALLVDNYTSGSTSGFTLTFGGACNGGTAVIGGSNASFTYTNPSCGSYQFGLVNPLPANAGYLYKWNFGDGTPFSTLPNPTHQYATGDAYTVTLTISTPLGCGNTSSQTLIVPLTLELEPTADTCVSSPVILKARNLANFAATTYTWAALGGISGTFNQLNDSTTEVFPRHPTTYQVKASALDCRDSLTVWVIPTVAPTAAASPATGILPLSVDFTPTNLLPAQDGFAYDSIRWDFGDNSPASTDPTPTHVYDSLGVFYVVMTAVFEGGCSQTDTVAVISVFPGTIPNIFTPDGDGINDKLVLKFTNQAIELKVFNRWGKLVYESSDYKQDWSPKDLPSGIYYYQVINSKPESGRPAGYKGWLDIHQQK